MDSQPQSSSAHSSAQSSPIHMQKMQFKLQQRLSESPLLSQNRKIAMKAASALDLSNGPPQSQSQPPHYHTHQQSLMLHQQQKFPHQNHPIEQQMYQQFYAQKPLLNHLMKIQGNNASLADFRSIVHTQPVEDMIASKEQLHAIVNAQKHSDYIVEDYMEKIQTRIALLETELKFADRKLHVLYSEYNDMLAKIDKLESLTIAQQQVLSNLLDLCNNQSQEVTAAKAIQVKAAQLFGIDPQAIIMHGEVYQEGNPFEQETVNTTATEFNELLEDMKNEAIIEGLPGKIPYNFYEGDADYEALIGMLNKSNFNFMNASEHQQHLLQQQNAMELLKNLSEAQMNMEMDFFRSGEVNKNLFDIKVRILCVFFNFKVGILSRKFEFLLKIYSNY